MKKIVLVYSGGLDTSVCIPLVREEYGFDHVITVTVDVGQPKADIEQAETKARAMGTEHYTIDAKEEFVSDYIYPAIRANGDYQGYPLSTAIARPLIGLKAAEIAKKLGADAFCHGCTGKGNDQYRIEFVLRALCPETPIIAPMRERNLTRSEEIEYAKQKGVPIAQSTAKIWSIDENLWGRSIEGGHLEEPDYAPPEEIFIWTKGINEAPNTPRRLAIDFEDGVPVAIDGERMSCMPLVNKMHAIAGENGVGRVDIMEDRLLGLKVRENYECPAAIALITAHSALEALVLTREERAFKMIIDQKWGEMAYAGLWFDALKEDLEGFIAPTQKRVTGTVYLELFKGHCKVIGRKSPWALYSEDLASFDSKTFDQSEATGIVKAHGMQSRMYMQLKSQLAK
ncbi:MAG TPA: argininosuccinate synthase [Armatimonadota bacterium]|nr:argininosuccinate synthase [Armatimonadota bacterium]